MSVSQKEQLMSLLFQDGIKPLNLKFFRFGCESVTEEQLCAEFSAALLQKQSGTIVSSTKFPENVSPKEIQSLLENQ